MVRIWSRPYGLCHRPYTLAHIKGFGSPDFHVYACLLLCLISMLASLDLGFAMFDALSGFVVRSDAHEALFRCNHLGCISVRWYAYHACLCHLLAFYASLHTFLHVHARVLLASMSSILQHNKVLDIWSKPTFVPPQTPSLICLLSCLIASFFVCLIVRLLILLLVMSPATCYTCFACMLVYFIPILHYLHISFFHCLSAGFLSLPLHVHTWSKDAWS